MSVSSEVRRKTTEKDKTFDEPKTKDKENLREFSRGRGRVFLAKMIELLESIKSSLQGAWEYFGSLTVKPAVEFKSVSAAGTETVASLRQHHPISSFVETTKQNFLKSSQEAAGQLNSTLRSVDWLAFAVAGTIPLFLFTKSVHTWYLISEARLRSRLNAQTIGEQVLTFDAEWEKLLKVKERYEFVMHHIENGRPVRVQLMEMICLIDNMLPGTMKPFLDVLNVGPGEAHYVSERERAQLLAISQTYRLNRA